MNILYLILCLVAIGYIIFSKRKLNFLSIFVLSITIYSFPIMFGKIFTNSVFINLDINTITVSFLFLLSAFFTIVLVDRVSFFKIINGPRVVNTQNFTMAIMSVLGILLLLISIYHFKGTLSSDAFSKTTLLQDSNKLTEYYKFLSVFLFVYGFTNRGKYILFIRLIALLMIGYTFILGHRSFIVISLVAIFFHWLYHYQVHRTLFSLICRHKKMVICVIVLILITFFIKNITAALFSGQYDLVFERLKDPDYYMTSFFNSEPNAIVTNLNNVVVSKMSYSIVEYILYPFFSLIPLLGGALINMLHLASFESLLNLQFNSQLSEGIGLGSSFLGETYATGGIALIILMGALYVILISLLNKVMLQCKTRIWYTFFLITLSYMAFYFYRNSLVYLLITIRSYLYIAGVAYVLHRVMRNSICKKITKGGN